MKTETLRVDADTTLALRVYEPAGAPHASVVIGAAMGVRQDFYAAFAAWLAEQGFRVTTFDYWGHGYSLQGPMRAVRADLLDWVRDYEAVIATAKAAQPAQPLFLIGHSLGAQLPGLMTDTSAIDGMLGVAAGSGYWRDNAPRLRTVVHFFWWVLVPMATWLLRNEGASLPQSQHLQKFSSVVLLGDFLEKPEDIAATVRSLASRGVSGHIVQINDPAEETLPYDGRIEFRAMDGPLKYLAGKTELLRDAYGEKFAAQREAELRQSFVQAGVDTLELSTDDDLVQTVMRFADLRKRRSRLSGASAVVTHPRAVA